MEQATPIVGVIDSPCPSCCCWMPLFRFWCLAFPLWRKYFFMKILPDEKLGNKWKKRLDKEFRYFWRGEWESEKVENFSSVDAGKFFELLKMYSGKILRRLFFQFILKNFLCGISLIGTLKIFFQYYFSSILHSFYSWIDKERRITIKIIYNIHFPSSQIVKWFNFSFRGCSYLFSNSKYQQNLSKNSLNSNIIAVMKTFKSFLMVRMAQSCYRFRSSFTPSKEDTNKTR